MLKNAGFTLIEVLVSLILLSVGLLGLAALQANSLKNNQSAYNRSQATQLTYDIADRMRANVAETNKLALSEYIATTTPVAQVNCANTTGCTPVLMAQNDRFEWNAALAGTLSSGTGTISVDPATRVFTITINWIENRDENDDSIADTTSFQTSLQL
jgi:type IV pilus assembly protein PilV